MSDAAAILNALRAHVVQVPASEAENEGWPERAMPGMLAELGLSEAPAIGWFVSALNPSAGKAEVGAWRYCHEADERGPDLLGITYAGPPPRVYLRGDVSLTRALQTLGHELYHLREFARGEPADETAADDVGGHATARVLAGMYP